MEYMNNSTWQCKQKLMILTVLTSTTEAIFLRFAVFLPLLA